MVEMVTYALSKQCLHLPQAAKVSYQSQAFLSMRMVSVAI